MAQASWFVPKVGSHLALLCHLSREPGELCRDDSTIKGVLDIIIIIIIIIPFHLPAVLPGADVWESSKVEIGFPAF